MLNAIRISALLCLSALLLPALAAAQVGPDAFGYTAEVTGYDFVTLGDGTGSLAGVEMDDGEAEHGLPFTFNFYGNEYDFVTVGDNGALRFSDGSGPLQITFSNASLPSSSSSSPDIMPFWDDMDSGEAGDNIFVYDDPVSGAFIVSWENIQHWSSSPSGAYYQVHLLPDSTIEFHYEDVLFDTSADSGASATVGIQDVAGGTKDAGNALEISYNTASLFAGDAWLLSFPDADGDGVATDSDCDDTDPSIYPGAPETCGDGLDQDCNGFDQLSDLDLDSDNDPACGGGDCDDNDPTVSSLIDGDADGSNACDDCDDADATAFPGNAEVCDGIDNDCDGEDDPLDDEDADGSTVCDGDCDDDDDAVFPGAPEVLCDGIDNDCDELTEDVGDSDLDGVACDSDCDDADPAVFPGALELCDSVDSDCDGLDDAFDLSIGAVGGTPLTPVTSSPGAAVVTTVDDTITVAETGTVSDVNVTINLPHVYTGDLDLFLTHVASGIQVELSTGNGGSGDDYTDTTFDDDAADPITSGSAPFTGSWLPEGDLNLFNGEEAAGDWTLNVIDTWTSSDDGTLVDWTLSIEVGGVTDDADDDGAVDSCGDCDNTNADIFPGAEETCDDTIDQDCDGADDTADADADGYGNADCGGDDCDDSDATLNLDDTDEDGFTSCDGDCDDTLDTVNPDAEEICADTIDQDCDGADETGDEDGDTFVSEFCGGDDCDDADDTVNPVAVDDACDELDPNCDGIDLDADGDGFGDSECDGSDCDDADAAVFPGAVEICDTVDSDCDGLDDVFDLDVGLVVGAPLTPVTSSPGAAVVTTVDDTITVAETGTVSDVNVTINLPHVYTGDLDLFLTHVASGIQVELSTGNGGSGDDYTDTTFDDDAADPITSGSAPFTGSWLPEGDLNLFNGEEAAGDWTLNVIDTWTSSDDGTLVDWTLTIEVGGTDDDADGDGAVDACGDCDSTDADIFPGAQEVCGDTIDNDCDGVDNELDEDLDGFENPICGEISTAPDCDDSDATINPDALEICNDGIDQNCNEDEDGENPDDLFDNDLDGALCDVDCDDAEPLAFPGAPEVCDDGFDNNCDGLVDTGDLDLDGFDCSLDCDDTNPNIFPGAPELLCDSLDNDCDPDGTPDIDDGDLDTFDCDVDCDDSNPATNPAALEIPCDGLDNDCDLEIDTDDGANNDVDEDGATCDVDCDDEDPTRSPDLPELCDDSIDNDCDPSTDDDQDFDGDGFACTLDCDDVDPLTFPGAPEICADSIDQDCDGTVDEAAADEYPLDDGDSLLIGLCTFSLDFCGDSFDTIYVNDNGVISFGDAFGDSAESITAFGANAPLLAGLWTNLDPGTAGTVEVIEEDGVGVDVVYTGVSQFGLPGTANSFALTIRADGTMTIDYGNVDEAGGIVGFSCGAGLTTVDLSAGDDNGLGFFGDGTGDGIVEQFSDLGNPNDTEDQIIEFCLTTGEVDGDSDGWTATCGDCDDDDDTTFPGAEELCDTLDNDCDGVVDNVDLDEDGFLDADCGGDDCDDADPDSNPDAVEICDGLDNDCDGDLEDGGADEDLDGFQICGGDCNDEDADVNPDAEEVCDLVDNDCDGVEDNGFNSDVDADGFVSEECGGDDCDDTRAGSNPDGVEVCDLADNDCNAVIDDIDNDADGFLDADCEGDDCDDADEAVNPDADEVPYDGIDNDCDGEDTVDADGDGFADSSVDGGTDCDDSADAVFPGAEEICDDEIDNDCDDLTDADDDECGACADCESSISASPRGTGLLGLVIALAFGIRRRRS